MVQKIVVNRCYGGFGLSIEGLLYYAQLKGYTPAIYKETKFDFKILNEIFELYKKNELTFNISINDENYRSKNEIINIQKGISQKYTFNLVPKNA
jgi:hypothetical protein